MNGTKGTLQVAPTLTSLASTSRQNNWFRRFISPALQAQTIPAGTTSLWNVWAGGQASNSAGGWSVSRGCIYVWRPSTGALVGKIIDAPATGGVGTVGTSEIITAAGAFNGTADVVCQDGDVIVCELWGGGTQSMATAYTWTIGYDGTVDTGGSGGGGTGNAIASAASCMNSPPLILLGEGTPVSGTDANVGSANETAYVEVSDFPQNAVIDNFNRADGILTSPWVGMTIPTQTYLTPYVSSNQASTGPPGNGCGAYRSDQSFGDCEAYIDLPNPAETQYHDVWLRFTGGTDINAQNGYYLRHDSVGNKLMLQKVSGGGSSTVGQQANCTLSPGDSIGARVLGTTFSIYYKPLGAAKWRILGTGVDATYQNAGSTGFFSPGHPAVFDNFGGGSIVTAKSDVDATGINEVETTTVNQKFSDADNTGINEVEVATLLYAPAGVDANGATTESAAPKSLTSDVDANGTTTESATSTPATQVSASDTNGTVTESSSAVSFPQTGLQLHFDASALALANGAAVSPWPNLAQPGIPGNMVGSPAPTFQTGQINDGKGVVRFRAGQGMLRATAIGVSTPFTLAYVAHYIGANATQQRIVSTDYPPNNFLIGFWGPSGGPGYFDTVYDGGWASGEPSTVATLAWKLYSADQSGVNVPTRLFSDGTLVRSGGSGSQNFGGTFHLSGQDPTAATESSDCEVAEVFLYNRQLSDAERQQLENYLRNKWFKNAPAALDTNGTVSESATLVIRDTDSNGATTETGSYGVNVVVYEPDFVGTYNMLQSLYSPYTTIPASFGTYDAIGGAPLPLPVLTEVASYQVNVPVSDSNGPTSESAAFFYAPASADAGTASEAASPVVRATVTDSNASTTETAVLVSVPAVTDANGTTTETASVTRVILTDTDNAGFTAAQSVVSKLADTDVGSASDTASIFQALVPVSASDTNGTTTETQSFTYALSASDTNSSLTETASFLPSYVGVDSGTSSESATVPKALISAFETTPSSIEAATTGVPVYNGDTGSASDSASVVTKITASDSGSATETGIGSLTSSFTVTDQNTATTESAALAEATSDSGTGTDTATVKFLVTVTDSGSLTSESQSLATLNQKTDADYGGTPIEVAILAAQQTPGGDQASATESASASIYIAGADVGAGIDVSAAPVAKISVSDSGTGSDTIFTGGRVSVTDSGTASELAALAFSSLDTATGFASEILAARLTDADYGYAGENYDRYPPLTLFPEIPAGVILSMAMGEIVNASSVGTYRRLTNVRGRATTSARGRILK